MTNEMSTSLIVILNLDVVLEEEHQDVVLSRRTQVLMNEVNKAYKVLIAIWDRGGYVYNKRLLRDIRKTPKYAENGRAVP